MAKTKRQHLIQMVGYKLGIHNYNAYARLNDLPFTEDWQAKVDEHQDRFNSNLICEHVDQMYSTMFTNSVESFLMGYIQQTHISHSYQEYVDSLNERAFKMLMNAIIKEGQRVTDIHVDAETAKIRMARRESRNMLFDHENRSSINRLDIQALAALNQHKDKALPDAIPVIVTELGQDAPLSDDTTNETYYEVFFIDETVENGDVVDTDYVSVKTDMTLSEVSEYISKIEADMRWRYDVTCYSIEDEWGRSNPERIGSINADEFVENGDVVYFS